MVLHALPYAGPPSFSLYRVSVAVQNIHVGQGEKNKPECRTEGTQ